MDTPRQSSIARLAAIAALTAAFVVLMVVVVISLAGDGESADGGRQANGNRGAASGQERRPERRIYVVKPGDCCLSQIAQKTGVDVDTLVELNPNLDPQAIHSGDRVKLR